VQLLKRFNDRESLPIHEQYAEGMLEIHAHLVGRDDLGVCLCVRDLASDSADAGFKQLPVFVYVGQFVKQLQKRKAIVRLNRLDECDLFAGEISQAVSFTAVPISFKDLFRRIDRKLRIVLLGSGIDSGQHENQVVERGADMEKKFTDKSTGLVLNLIQEAKQNKHPFSFSLTAAYLESGLACAVNERVQLIELFLCPQYPELRLIKYVPHGN